MWKSWFVGSDLRGVRVVIVIGLVSFCLLLFLMMMMFFGITSFGVLDDENHPGWEIIMAGESQYT